MTDDAWPWPGYQVAPCSQCHQERDVVLLARGALCMSCGAADYTDMQSWALYLVWKELRALRETMRGFIV